MPKKTAIVVHHFASHWGNAAVCRDWHVNGNGWRDIGYHYIVNNGYPTYSDYAKGKRRKEWDGKVELGRSPDTSVGAHVKEGNMNSKSIGISLVGNFDTYEPTEAQMQVLVTLIVGLCRKYDISPDQIWYHRDYAINKDTGKPYKSCPGNEFISRAKLRQMVKDELAGKAHPAAAPMLVVNGTVIEGAYAERDAVGRLRWFAPHGQLRNLLGHPSSEPKRIMDVATTIGQAGHVVETTNNRIKQRNRFDIRTARA